MIRILFMAVALIPIGAASGMAQNDDCSAKLLGQSGCGQGSRPYVSQMGDTLGSRGGNWYTSDPDPNDNTYGAYPYSKTLGQATDATGRPHSKTLGGGCDPLQGDC